MIGPATPGRGPGVRRPRRPGTPDVVALQATDALLDRLGGRGPTPDDLADPVTALLAELAREVDVETDAARQVRRVLAGRTSRAGQWFEHPDAVFPRPIPPRSARAAAHRRATDAAHAAASRVARALPTAAAAAGVLLAVSGGVSAAVTGNPMAPITSIGRVVTLLAPDQADPSTLSTVRRTLTEARAAADQGEVERARRLLVSARHGLPAVPRSAAGGLQRQISALEGQIAGDGRVTAPTATATATRTPTALPSPTTTATATVTPQATNPSATPPSPSPSQAPSASPTILATPNVTEPTPPVTATTTP